MSPASPPAPRFGPIAAVFSAAVALAVAGGCSRGEDAGTGDLIPIPVTEAAQPLAVPATPAATDRGSFPPTPTATPTSAAAASAPPPTTVPLDAALMLTTALDALGAGYHFATTATVAGNLAVSAEGDHIAGATHMVVTSGGTSTEYIVTPAAAWALADGAWQQLDSAAGLPDPIGQLRSPLTATAAGTPAAAVLTAQYPNRALGLPGDGRAAVEFEITDGRITALRYATVVVLTNADGSTVEQPAEVAATIGPVAPGTEITLPSA